MTIDKINLGKVFKKETKAEKQEKQIPTIEVRTEEGTLAKLRGASAARLLAVMMGVATMGGMTSCINNEATAIADNKQMLEIMDKILKAQETNNNLLVKLLAEMQQNNVDNKLMIELLQQQISQNNEILNILNSIGEDVADIKAALIRIETLMKEANQNDEEFKNKIDIIIAGQGSDSEKLQQLIDLNTEQNTWLINIADLIGTLKENGSELGDIIKQFYTDYVNNSEEFKNNDKDHTTLMNLIYQALLTSNEIDKAILAEIQKIQKSSASDSEKLAQIIDLLTSIDNKMTVLVDEVKKISADLSIYVNNQEAYEDQSLALLEGIFKNTGSADAKISQLIANQEKQIANQIKLQGTTDEILANLKQMNGKMFTLDELRDMLGPLFDKISGELTAEMISADELSAILEAYKTDLTKTNSLIENLTDVVKNLNFNGGGMSQEQIDAIIAAINAFKNQEATNDEAQMDAYREIISQLANLNNGMEAIGAALTELSTNFNAYAKNAATFGNSMLAEMAKIRAGQSTAIANMEMYAAKMNEYMTQAEAARNQQIALLQALVDKETGGNGGITKEELEEVLAGMGVNIPDYSAILEEIRDAIGNVITSDDLQNFFLKTKPDLTKTNSLIETLIDVLKNKNFSVTGDVSINMDGIESKLAQIFELLSKGKTPTQDQITELIDLVNQLVASQDNSATSRTMAMTANSFFTENTAYFAFYDALASNAAQNGYNA